MLNLGVAGLAGSLLIRFSERTNLIVILSNDTVLLEGDFLYTGEPLLPQKTQIRQEKLIKSFVAELIQDSVKSSRTDSLFQEIDKLDQNYISKLVVLLCVQLEKKQRLSSCNYQTFDQIIKN